MRFVLPLFLGLSLALTGCDETAVETPQLSQELEEVLSQQSSLFRSICLPVFSEKSLDAAQERASRAGFAQMAIYRGATSVGNGSFSKRTIFAKEGSPFQVNLAKGTATGGAYTGVDTSIACSIVASKDLIGPEILGPYEKKAEQIIQQMFAEQSPTQADLKVHPLFGTPAPKMVVTQKRPPAMTITVAY